MVTISELIQSGKLYIRKDNDQHQLYEFLARTLYDEGYVKESFEEALKEREKQYPTGIVSNPYNIALPHVDEHHVKKNALVVIIEEEPLLFHRMDCIKEEIEVKVIFLLLIKDLNLHMQAISNLTKLWFDEEFMKSVLSIQSKEELIRAVQQIEMKNGSQEK